MLSQGTLPIFFVPQDRMSFPKALLHPQLLGHLTDTRPSAQTFLHSAATHAKISHPANHFKLQKHFPFTVPILEVCLQTQAGQRGAPCSHIPAEEGWPHQDRVAGSAPRVLPWVVGTHAHTTAHVCTHTGSVCTSRAHCWPDLHYTGSSCPSARAGVSTHKHSGHTQVPPQHWAGHTDTP